MAKQKRALTLTWPQSLALGWALLTLLFWALNPGATQGFGAVLRLVFWAVHVAIPLLFCQIAQVLLTERTELADWPAVLVSGLLGGTAFLPVAFALDRLFPDLDGPETEPFLTSIASEAGSTLLPIALAWVALNAPRILTVVNVETPAEEPAFWQKVPADLGRDLAALSAELHYLRVYTTKGNALILYPFGHALEDLGNADGEQIHRSHWLAFQHVEAVERRGEGARVRIIGDTWLPVSRRYRKVLFDQLEQRSRL